VTETKLGELDIALLHTGSSLGQQVLGVQSDTTDQLERPLSGVAWDVQLTLDG
jgi:hypothetical protein